MINAPYIIVADDHPVFREGLARLIGGSLPFARIVEAASMDEVEQLATGPDTPQLLVLDLMFPGMVLSATLPKLRQRLPRTSIIVVSMMDDAVTAATVMSAGADGFVSKALASERMLEAIHAVMSGGFVTLADAGLGSTASLGPTRLEMPELTPRQREVLEGIANGKSNKEIGRMLAISPFTVRIHVSALLRSLKVETRSEAVAKAKSLGL
jgi:DNA-binding NarL/FixJ family response regulator